MRGKLFVVLMIGLVLTLCLSTVGGIEAHAGLQDDLDWPDLTQITLYPEDVGNPDYRDGFGQLHTESSAVDSIAGSDPELAEDAAEILDRYGFRGMYTHRFGRLRPDGSGQFEEYVETYALAVEDGEGAFSAFQEWAGDVLGSDLEVLPSETTYADESTLYRVRGTNDEGLPFVGIGVDLRRSHLLAGVIVVAIDGDEPEPATVAALADRLTFRINSNEGDAGTGAAVLRLDGTGFSDQNDLRIDFGDAIPQAFETPEDVSRRQDFSDVLLLEEAHYLWQRSTNTDGEGGFADYIVHAFQSTSDARVEANRDRLWLGTLEGEEPFQDIRTVDRAGVSRITLVYDDGGTADGYRAELIDGSSFATVVLAGSPAPNLDAFLELIEAQMDCLEAEDGCTGRFPTPKELFAPARSGAESPNNRPVAIATPEPNETEGSGAAASAAVAFAAGDVARTGTMPGPGPSAAPDLVWRADLSDSPLPQADLVLVDGVLFVATLDGSIQAIDATTGTLLWRTFVDAQVTDPAVVDAVVYTGTLNGVTALDAASGDVLWTATIGGQVTSSPAVSHGLVLVGAFGDEPGVYALSAESGDLRWHYATSAPVGVALAVAQETVYGHSWAGEVFALDAASGEEQWSVAIDDADGLGGGGMLVTEGMALLSAGDLETGAGALIALDAATGQERWRYPTLDRVPVAVVLDGLVWARFGVVAALDAESGQPVWVSGPIEVAGISAADGVLYLASGGANLRDPGDDELIAIDAVTQTILWTKETPLGHRGAPLVAGGVVYVCGEGTVYALAAPE